VLIEGMASSGVALAHANRLAESVASGSSRLATWVIAQDDLEGPSWQPHVNGSGPDGNAAISRSAAVERPNHILWRTTFRHAPAPTRCAGRWRRMARDCARDVWDSFRQAYAIRETFRQCWPRASASQHYRPRTNV